MYVQISDRHTFEQRGVDAARWSLGTRLADAQILHLSPQRRRCLSGPGRTEVIIGAVKTDELALDHRPLLPLNP